MSSMGKEILSRGRRRAAGASARHAEAADTPLPSAYFRWKTFLDRALAALLLAPALPIIGLLLLLVRLTSRGPGIYRQVRVGQHGRKFMMYKIRTMRHDAEAASGPVWTTLAHDPRVTPVGRLLRQFHLDELPQLLNILKGEMSLVGPRPERPEFVRVLAEAIPNYRSRLAVPPGITGLAQLNLPPDTDLDSVRRKLVLDWQYIQQAGLLLDFRLFLCTFLRMFKLPERWLLPMLGLHRSVTISAITEGAPGEGANDTGHGSATPGAILVQAASVPIKNDGAAGRNHRSSNSSYRSNTRPKPK